MESIFPEHIVECITNCFSDTELVAYRLLYPRLDVGKALRQRRIARKALRIGTRWHFAASLRQRSEYTEELANVFVTEEQIRLGVNLLIAGRRANNGPDDSERFKNITVNMMMMVIALYRKGWFDKDAAVPLIGGMSEFFPFMESISDDKDLLDFMKLCI